VLADAPKGRVGYSRCSCFSTLASDAPKLGERLVGLRCAKIRSIKETGNAGGRRTLGESHSAPGLIDPIEPLRPRRR
jgi:hypothetical protein